MHQESYKSMLTNTKHVFQWIFFVVLFLTYSCSIHRESSLSKHLFVKVGKNSCKQPTSNERKIELNQNIALTQPQNQENGIRDEGLKTDFSYTDTPIFSNVTVQEIKEGNSVQQEIQFPQKKQTEKNIAHKGKQKAVVGFVLPFIGALLGFIALILLMFSSVVHFNFILIFIS